MNTISKTFKYLNLTDIEQQYHILKYITYHWDKFHINNADISLYIQANEDNIINRKFYDEYTQYWKPSNNTPWDKMEFELEYGNKERYDQLYSKYVDRVYDIQDFSKYDKHLQELATEINTIKTTERNSKQKEIKESTKKEVSSQKIEPTKDDKYSEILLNIIHEFNAEDDIIILGEIFTDLIENHDQNIEDIMKWTQNKNINNGVFEFLSKGSLNIKGIDITIQQNEKITNKTYITNYYRQLVQQLPQPQKTTYIIRKGTLDEKGYYVDEEEGIIYHGKIADDNKTLAGHPEAIIQAYPKKLTIYTDAIAQGGEGAISYSCEWQYHNHTETIEGTMETTLKKIESHTGVIKSSQLKDMINTVYTYMENNKNVQRIEAPRIKGFYYNYKTDKIETVQYTEKTPTREEVIQALNTLESLTKYLDPQKVAVILRWSLIAPYQYIIKQQGGHIRYLHLYGEAGTGKTTIYGNIPFHIWDLNHYHENTESGAATSESQMRNVFQATTFPMLYDDTENILSSKTGKALIKTSTTSPFTKRLTDMKTQEKIRPPAFASIIFTSNNDVQSVDTGATLRRFIKIYFGKEDQQRSIKNKQAFKKEYSKRGQSKLRNMKHIGQLFHQYMKQDPWRLTDGNATEEVNKFMEEIYKKYKNTTPPKWIYYRQKDELISEDDEIRRENIRVFMRQEINKELRGNSIQLNESELSTTTMDDTIFTWIEKINPLIREFKISWIYPKRNKNNTIDVIITTKINTEYTNKTGINTSLTSIAELFGWSIKTHRKNDGKGRIRGIKIPIDKFIKELYT